MDAAQGLGNLVQPSLTKVPDALSRQAPCLERRLPPHEAKGVRVMYPLVMSYPTLAVSAIYCIWNTYLRLRVKQEQTLRQRVAFMLWVMVNPLE